MLKLTTENTVWAIYLGRKKGTHFSSPCIFCLRVKLGRCSKKVDKVLLKEVRVSNDATSSSSNSVEEPAVYRSLLYIEESIFAIAGDTHLSWWRKISKTIHHLVNHFVHDFKRKKVFKLLALNQLYCHGTNYYRKSSLFLYATACGHAKSTTLLFCYPNLNIRRDRLNLLRVTRVRFRRFFFFTISSIALRSSATPKIEKTKNVA